MNPLFIAPVTKLINKVIDKAVPDKEAAAKIKLDIERQAANLDLEEQKSFWNFIVQYEGSGDKMPVGIQYLRASVRPILTYFLAGAYIYGFLQGTYKPEEMAGLWQLNLISLGFWYGERALKNLNVNLNTLFTRKPKPFEGNNGPVALD